MLEGLLHAYLAEHQRKEAQVEQHYAEYRMACAKVGIPCMDEVEFKSKQTESEVLKQQTLKKQCCKCCGGCNARD